MLSITHAHMDSFRSTFLIFHIPASNTRDKSRAAGLQMLPSLKVGRMEFPVWLPVFHWWWWWCESVWVKHKNKQSPSTTSMRCTHYEATIVTDSEDPESRCFRPKKFMLLVNMGVFYKEHVANNVDFFWLLTFRSVVFFVLSLNKTELE